MNLQKRNRQKEQLTKAHHTLTTPRGRGRGKQKGGGDGGREGGRRGDIMGLIFSCEVQCSSCETQSSKITVMDLLHRTVCHFVEPILEMLF